MRRVSELESLRGLAALSILVYHLRPAAYDIGWSRVDFFLVLTGFLLTTTTLKHGDAPNFLGVLWARRALRIWPVYFLALFGLVLVNGLLPRPFPMAGLPYYLTLTQNLPLFWSSQPPAFSNYFGHTWTLALDAQFVLVWPVLVRWAGRRRIVPLSVGLAIASLFVRAGGYHPWLLPARCDGYALGGLLASLFADESWMGRHRAVLRRVLKATGLAALAALVTASVTLGRPNFSAAMTLGPSLRIGLGCLLYASILGLAVSYRGHPALEVLRGRVLGFLGRISYGLYVYHAMVFIGIAVAARRMGWSQSPALEVVMIAAAMGVAALSWQYLERPLLSYRDRFRFRAEAPAAVGRGPDERIPGGTPILALPARKRHDLAKT